MIRRLAIRWPDARPFERRGRQQLRVLAVSDEPDRSLEHGDNLASLGPIDLLVGAGDLPADYLDYLAHRTCALMIYVKGNHDVGDRWQERHRTLPEPLRDGRFATIAGLPVVGLGWPSWAVDGRGVHDEGAAWRQIARVQARMLLRRPEPFLVLSHVPPLGAGDAPGDPYHAGFEAYRWLLDRLRPPLWLHGHTPLAAVPWRTELPRTTLLNVTGAVLLELNAPGREDGVPRSTEPDAAVTASS